MKKNEIRALLHDFYTFDACQKWMIDQRIDAISDQIYFNIASKNPSREEIVKEIQEVIVANCQELKLPDPEGFPAVVQAIYSSLFTDKLVAYNSKELLSLVFVRKDTFILKKMRDLLQLTLLRIFDQLHQRNIAHELLIGHILSYLPFFAVDECESFEIPVVVNGGWKLAKYSAQKIPLTPAVFGSQIFAIGLQANNAPPLLLFKGTSYPTDEGFGLGVLTDINPGASVGAYVFYLGKDRIAKWLANQKAQVFGLSLGGTLALQTAAHFPENIDTVFAYNPPALFSHDLKNWEKYKNAQPKVHVIYHENDVVPTFGFKWGVNWNIYRIYLSRKLHFLPAHFKCFAARQHNLILRSNRKQDERKWSRCILASVHQLLTIFLFPLGVMIYFCKNIFSLIKSILFKRS